MQKIIGKLDNKTVVRMNIKLKYVPHVDSLSLFRSEVLSRIDTEKMNAKAVMINLGYESNESAKKCLVTARSF